MRDGYGGFGGERLAVNHRPVSLPCRVSLRETAGARAGQTGRMAASRGHGYPPNVLIIPLSGWVLRLIPPVMGQPGLLTSTRQRAASVRRLRRGRLLDCGREPLHWEGTASAAGQLLSPTRFRFISKKRTGS